MAKPTNHLRFFLSLGNQRMVVLGDEQALHIYDSSSAQHKGKHAVAAHRVSEALAK